MKLFSKIFSGSSQTVIRCDEAEFLIWKYPEAAVKSGTSITVKDGEVAVLIGSSQTYVEGPSNQTVTEKLSEVYFINLAGSNVVRFAVPYFGVNDPRFPDLNVPVAVRGSLNFNIEDYRGFMRMHRLIGFDMEVFQKKIKDAVVKYVKAVVSNVPTDNGIPIVQMEKKILEIGEILHKYMKYRFAVDFAINIRAVDLNAIEYDADDENYKQLRTLTHDKAVDISKIQHDIQIKSLRQQDEMDSKMKLMEMEKITSNHELEIRKNQFEREIEEKRQMAQFEEEKKSGRFGNNGMGLNLGTRPQSDTHVTPSASPSIPPIPDPPSQD